VGIKKEGIKKGGDLKRGAPLHVVEGSRVFWGTGPKISSSTHRVEELVPQNPYFPTTVGLKDRYLLDIRGEKVPS